MNARTKGIIFAALAFSIFAIGDAAYKYLMGFYPVFVISFFSSLSGSMILLILSRRLGGLKQTFQSAQLRLHLLRAGILVCQILMAIYAFGHLSMAETYSLLFAFPFLVALFSAVFYRKPPSKAQAAAIIVGFIGILIVLRPGIIPLGLPSLAALAGAVLFALAFIIVHGMDEAKETKLSFVLFPQVMMLIVSSIMAISVFTLPTPFHFFLMVIGGMTSVGGTMLLSRAFLIAPPSSVAPTHYSQMIWAIGFGYFLFGDVPDIWTLVGALVIAASGIWLLRHEREKFE